MAQGKNTNQRVREPRKSGGIWSGILIGLLTGLAGAAAVAVWVGRNNPFTERTDVSASQVANPATSNATANGTNSKGTGVIDPATRCQNHCQSRFAQGHVLQQELLGVVTGMKSCRDVFQCVSNQVWRQFSRGSRYRLLVVRQRFEQVDFMFGT